NRPRVVLHLGLQRLDPAAVHQVDLVVALGHGSGELRVPLTVGAHHVLEHLVGEVGDPAHLDARRAYRDVGQLDRVLRDVDGVVSDSLEVGDDLEHPGDVPQLAGDRLLFPNQLDARTLHAPPGVVDLVV